ncbi:uncharacterized protein LOC131898942 [Peromyscus eremicus]|uniref:uncharacterized protein LOC131898942 n=1 Tax=Peromyscus eremicus TaxID=42410 RepID=UPI0027DADEE9|nr:uncharacterized protein LOC131898942 [Peromyscus eremicus]
MLFTTEPKILEGSPSPLLSQYETIGPWAVVFPGVTTSRVLLVLGHHHPTALAGPGSALEAPSLLAALTWKLGSADLRPSWQLYCSPCVILSKVSPGSKLEFSTADLPSSLHLNIILQGFIKYLYKDQDRYPLKVHILSIRPPDFCPQIPALISFHSRLSPVSQINPFPELFWSVLSHSSRETSYHTREPFCHCSPGSALAFCFLVIHFIL